MKQSGNDRRCSEQKKKWFSENEAWENIEYRLDFRVGGFEYDRSIVYETGVEVIFDARYEDIVDNQRIVLAYTSTIDGQRVSSSLSTVEFHAETGGTRLTLAEQIAAFDEPDDEDERREGWDNLLRRLDEYLKNNG